MKHLYFLAMISLMGSSLLAQDDAQGCDGQRYFYSVFDDVTKTTVKFGENINSSGVNQELFMDVFEPLGDDLEARPTIVWAFGGAFITGNREDMEEACIEFAKRGFVAVTIDYRLYNIFLGVPDSLTVSQVVVQAIGDMKAAIRALRQDAATVNEFRVDTSRIIAGGVSAGGILANHCAYLDPDDPIPTFFMDVLEDNGGIEGNSGDADNLSYPSNVMMSVSLSGAIYDDLWMEAGDPPLATIHGTEDEIVPYMHGFASAPIGPSTVPLMSMDGSGRLHERADALGIPNFHVAVPNGGHEDIYFDIQYESYRNEFNWEGAIFMYEQLCPSIDILPNSTEDRTPQLELDVFPNPVNAYLLVQPPIINQPYRLSIFDSFGKAVYTASGLVGEVEWQRGALPAGMYYLQVMYEHRELPLLRRKVVLR